MGTVQYNKLVRDNIPSIIERDGKKAIVKTLSKDEYVKALNLKLKEELEEYLESQDVEELADVLEVIHGILDIKGVSFSQLEEIRKTKCKVRGAFRERLMLIKVFEE